MVKNENSWRSPTLIGLRAGALPPRLGQGAARDEPAPCKRRASRSPSRGPALGKQAWEGRWLRNGSRGARFCEIKHKTWFVSLWLANSRELRTKAVAQLSCGVELQLGQASCRHQHLNTAFRCAGTARLRGKARDGLWQPCRRMSCALWFAFRLIDGTETKPFFRKLLP